MKLFKQLIIWIPVMTIASLAGTFSVYLYWDKQVPESTMVISVVGGVVAGVLIGVIRYIKAKKAQ